MLRVSAWELVGVNDELNALPGLNGGRETLRGAGPRLAGRQAGLRRTGNKRNATQHNSLERVPRPGVWIKLDHLQPPHHNVIIHERWLQKTRD